MTYAFIYLSLGALLYPALRDKLLGSAEYRAKNRAHPHLTRAVTFTWALLFGPIFLLSELVGYLLDL